MLDSLWVDLAKFLLKAILVFVLKVKAGAGEDRILFDYLIQNVDVERKTLSTFKLLDELATDGAADTVFVVQLLDAVGAQGVAAVDQYARNSFAHVVLEAAKLADIESARLIVQIHQVDGHVDCCHRVALICKKLKETSFSFDYNLV